MNQKLTQEENLILTRAADAIKKIKTITETNKWKLAIFLVFCLLSLVTIALGLFNIFLIKNEILAIVISVISVILVLRFSLYGWFSTENYFKKIKVFHKEVKFQNGEERGLKRRIYTSSFGFLFAIIIISFFTALIFSAEVVYFFDEKNHAISETVAILIHLLLIPSFVHLFEVIIEQRSKLYNIMDNPFVKQSQALEDMFLIVEFTSNFTQLKFLEYDFISRLNIFFISNQKYSKEDQTALSLANEEILAIYKDLWTNYINLISGFYRLSAKPRRLVKSVVNQKMRNVMFIYLSIWDDFFIF